MRLPRVQVLGVVVHPHVSNATIVLQRIGAKYRDNSFTWSCDVTIMNIIIVLQHRSEVRNAHTEQLTLAMKSPTPGLGNGANLR